jgi:hypothetical protein
MVNKICWAIVCVLSLAVLGGATWLGMIWWTLRTADFGNMRLP